jgi:hypothetical protein
VYDGLSDEDNGERQECNNNTALWYGTQTTLSLNLDWHYKSRGESTGTSVGDLRHVGSGWSAHLIPLARSNSKSQRVVVVLGVAS